jgi:hypothetical protein
VQDHVHALEYGMDFRAQQAVRVGDQSELYQGADQEIVVRRMSIVET